MEAIKLVIGIVGALSFLFMMKTKVDEALLAIKAPDTLDFYFLFFWALVAALLGGLLWAGAQQAFSSVISSGACDATVKDPALTLGGAKEPHGLAAFLWPIVTNLPIGLLLVVIAWRYAPLSLKDAAVVFVIMVLSLSVAALIFYDLPLFGYRGFRCYLSSKEFSYQELEIYLVLIWSGLLATIAFGTLYAASKYALFSSLSVSLADCAVAIGLLVGVTVFSVGFFVVGYTYPGFESARGIVAGTALRISLFFGLISMFKVNFL